MPDTNGRIIGVKLQRIRLLRIVKSAVGLITGNRSNGVFIRQCMEVFPSQTSVRNKEVAALMKPAVLRKVAVLMKVSARWGSTVFLEDEMRKTKEMRAIPLQMQ